MKIIYKDDHIVVLCKESGFHIHPPEDKTIRVHRSKILLYQLRDQLQQKVYPVHRLDVATSGLVVMALSSANAANLCRQFQNQEVAKNYLAVVRGYIADAGEITQDLELDSTHELVPAQTSYQCLSRIELDHPVSLKHSTARYSLLRAQPHTGRYHQIRRHFNRISHPIIGDAYHGDSRHNRFFRNHLAVQGLCLRAQQLKFKHPMTNELLDFSADYDTKWQKIFELFRMI